MKRGFSRKKNVSKSFLKVIGIVASIVIIGVGGFFANEFFVSKNLREEIKEKTQVIDENKRTVFVATADIQKGQTVKLDSLVATEMLLSDDDYITAEDLEAVAVIDIKAGSAVTKQMIRKEIIQKDTREVEFTAVTLMANLAAGDVIDIRITYPNGEDYLVLSKKSVKNLYLSGNMFYSWLNAEEISRFSSAMVDAYLVEGSKLYAVKYIESNIQDAASPTYLVRQEVIDVMRKDPNIVNVAEQTLSAQARASLDSRLSNIDSTNADKINQQQQQESSYRQQMILDGVDISDNTSGSSATVQPDATNDPEETQTSTQPTSSPSSESQNQDSSTEGE